MNTLPTTAEAHSNVVAIDQRRHTIFDRRQLIAAAVAASLLATGGSALAQTDSIVGISTVTTYFADARIVAVDPIARTVTFALSNGAVTTSKVSPPFASFNTRKVGDRVSVAFEDSLTLVLPDSDARTLRDRDASAKAAAKAGKSTTEPAADTWWLANWCVVGVDPAAGNISVVPPTGGPVRIYSVRTAEGHKHLPRVKTGDYLTAIDPRKQVVSIAP